MFLSVLDREEKDAFMNLLYNVAKIDGNFTETEQAYINAYSVEMGLDMAGEDAYVNTNEELIEQLSSSSKRNQKVIYIELIGLMLTDGMHKKEKSFLDVLAKGFSITEDETAEIIKWVEDITPLYSKGLELAGLIDLESKQDS